jgi:hypothetical protein
MSRLVRGGEAALGQAEKSWQHIPGWANYWKTLST